MNQTHGLCEDLSIDLWACLNIYIHLLLLLLLFLLLSLCLIFFQSILTWRRYVKFLAAIYRLIMDLAFTSINFILSLLLLDLEFPLKLRRILPVVWLLQNNFVVHIDNWNFLAVLLKNSWYVLNSFVHLFCEHVHSHGLGGRKIMISRDLSDSWQFLLVCFFAFLHWL